MMVKKAYYDVKTGKVTYTYEGQEVGVIEVTITDEYYNEIHGIKEEVKEENQEKKAGLPFIVKLILGILAVIVIGFIALIGFVYYKRKQLEKKRRLRRMQYRQQREEQMRDW